MHSHLQFSSGLLTWCRFISSSMFESRIRWRGVIKKNDNRNVEWQSKWWRLSPYWPKNSGAYLHTGQKTMDLVFILAKKQWSLPSYWPKNKKQQLNQLIFCPFDQTDKRYVGLTVFCFIVIWSLKRRLSSKNFIFCPVSSNWKVFS